MWEFPTISGKDTKLTGLRLRGHPQNCKDTRKIARTPALLFIFSVTPFGPMGHLFADVSHKQVYRRGLRASGFRVVLYVTWSLIKTTDIELSEIISIC